MCTRVRVRALPYRIDRAQFIFVRFGETIDGRTMQPLLFVCVSAELRSAHGCSCFLLSKGGLVSRVFHWL